ncbi:MAG: ABC transporter permease [Chloroflexota bacterium]|nr:ABC transporter permease [Chloroflexota bacterium]MDE2968534.1 ABC transporter permease [Chloroflexota bacterium]
MADEIVLRPSVAASVPFPLRWARGFWAFVVTMFRYKPLGFAGFVIVVVLMFTAIFADFIAPYEYNDTNRHDQFAPPSLKHPIGADHLGRDLFSRIVHGSRISVSIGFGAVAGAMCIAISLGLLTGYYGGWLDKIIQRFVDGWMTFPGIVIALAMVAIAGPGLWPLIIILGLLFGIRGSRVVRGQVLAVMARPHIEVARSVGVSDLRLMAVHVFPNVLPLVIILATIEIPLAITIEASLSFLGFGIPPPAPSWGRMLSAEARQHMLMAPWLGIAPGLALSLTIFGWNMFGDALRDLLDPAMRGSLGER